MVADRLARIAQIQVKIEKVRRQRIETKHKYRMEINRLDALQSKLNMQVDIAFRELHYREFCLPKEYRRYHIDFQEGPVNIARRKEYFDEL